MKLNSILFTLIFFSFACSNSESKNEFTTTNSNFSSSTQSLDTLPITESSEFNGTIYLKKNKNQIQLLTQANDKLVSQSRMDLEHPTKLLDSYTQIMALITALSPSQKTAFNLGLGGGVLPRFFFSQNPNITITSVDIDSKIVDLAKQYFQVEHPRHTIVVQDGIRFLEETDQTWDILWVDAFTPKEGLPAAMKTTHFIALLTQRLNENGIIVANLWDQSQQVFSKLKAAYQRNFDSSISVSIPAASNQILAVSNHSKLTCQNFWKQHQQWFQNGLVSIQWENTTKACFETSMP